MKHFTVLTGMDQREEKECEAFCFESDLEKLHKAMPELKDSNPLKSLYDLEHVKHIVICIFTNKEGEEKRRLGGFSDVPKDEEDIKKVMTMVATSLEINLSNVKVEQSRGQK